MYRKRISTPKSDKNADVPMLDVHTDLTRASLVCLIRQKAMHFGSDRRVAVGSRPAVFIRHRDDFCFVLPATTHHKAGDPRFYALHTSDALWTEPEKARDGFVFCRYETVHRDNLLEKIGVLYPKVQLAIVEWLRSRY
jgi:hypothetical protein